MAAPPNAPHQLQAEARCVQLSRPRRAVCPWDTAMAEAWQLHAVVRWQETRAIARQGSQRGPRSSGAATWRPRPDEPQPHPAQGGTV